MTVFSLFSGADLIGEFNTRREADHARSGVAHSDSGPPSRRDSTRDTDALSKSAVSLDNATLAETESARAVPSSIDDAYVPRLLSDSIAGSRAKGLAWRP